MISYCYFDPNLDVYEAYTPESDVLECVVLQRHGSFTSGYTRTMCFVSCGAIKDTPYVAGRPVRTVGCLAFDGYHSTEVILLEI